jgi:hypothetical protein
LTRDNSSSSFLPKASKMQSSSRDSRERGSDKGSERGSERSSVEKRRSFSRDRGKERGWDGSVERKASCSNMSVISRGSDKSSERDRGRRRSLSRDHIRSSREMERDREKGRERGGERIGVKCLTQILETSGTSSNNNNSSNNLLKKKAENNLAVDTVESDTGRDVTGLHLTSSFEGRAIGVVRLTETSANLIAASWCDYITETASQESKRKKRTDHIDKINAICELEGESEYLEEEKSEGKTSGSVTSNTSPVSISLVEISNLAVQMVPFRKAEIVSVLASNRHKNDSVSADKTITTDSDEEGDRRLRCSGERSGERKTDRGVDRGAEGERERDSGTTKETERNISLLRNAFLEVVRNMRVSVSRAVEKRSAASLSVSGTLPMPLPLSLSLPRTWQGQGQGANVKGTPFGEMYSVSRTRGGEGEGEGEGGESIFGSVTNSTDSSKSPQRRDRGRDTSEVLAEHDTSDGNSNNNNMNNNHTCSHLNNKNNINSLHGDSVAHDTYINIDDNDSADNFNREISDTSIQQGESKSAKNSQKKRNVSDIFRENRNTVDSEINNNRNAEKKKNDFSDRNREPNEKKNSDDGSDEYHSDFEDEKSV